MDVWMDVCRRRRKTAGDAGGSVARCNQPPGDQQTHKQNAQTIGVVIDIVPVIARRLRRRRSPPRSRRRSVPRWAEHTPRSSVVRAVDSRHRCCSFVGLFVGSLVGSDNNAIRACDQNSGLPHCITGNIGRRGFGCGLRTVSRLDRFKG